MCGQVMTKANLCHSFNSFNAHACTYFYNVNELFGVPYFCVLLHVIILCIIYWFVLCFFACLKCLFYLCTYYSIIYYIIMYYFNGLYFPHFYLTKSLTLYSLIYQFIYYSLLLIQFCACLSVFLLLDSNSPPG